MGNSDRRKFIDLFVKMDIATWLLLALAVITLATPALSSEPRVVCYYTNWSVYRPGTAKFNPQNINPYLCTHLIYAFGGFTKDNTLKPFDKYQDIEKGGYAKFTGLKTYNKNLKTMLAIGGWNEGSTRFSPMVASKERRKEFVRNAIKFLRQNRFDGLDLDWEYPAFRDGGKPKDREHYAKLVRELREEFDREAEKTGRPRLLLTMAVPAGIEYIQKGFDVKTLNKYLDWMNLLTYDYHSAFEPAVNHHAPLYPLEEPNEYSVDSELNIDYTIKFYLESGADRDKLVLGIPTYGRSYTLFNADAVEIGAPADGPGEQGDATREKGYLAYYEICEALKPKEKKRSVSDDDESEEDSEEEEDLPWTVMQPNPNAMGPVAYRGNQWVGYDDAEIVKKKAEYVAENGLGGIMFWSIDNDDFRGTCHGKPYPLIEAAKEAYIVKLGSTDNAIVTDRPRSVTTSRSSSRRRSKPRSTTTTTARPSSAAKANNKRKSDVTSSTPAWNITPEPPTTPDPGSDFKCTDEGFFPHPRDCKKYFWCLDSGPSNLGIVAHQFTCPSGLFFNKAADSCDFARNVLCKKPASTTKAPITKATTSKAVSTTTTTSTTRRPVKLSTKNTALFRTTSTSTTPEPEEEEYEDDLPEDTADIDAEDPKVIKELIDLIKKVGGVEQLEKHLHLAETSVSTDGAVTNSPALNKKLYQKVLERTRGKTKLNGNNFFETAKNEAQNRQRGPQNAGLEASVDKDKLLRKDRPQYTTINRARPASSTTDQRSEEESIEEEVDDQPQQIQRARAVETQSGPKVATTAKPLQYVNIRRARPTTISTSDTADDTASRNALFERPASYVTVSETPNSLDIVTAQRDNMPEYVTIRRQRPTTVEATTEQYQNAEQEEESQETALEKEISSPSSQPQYTSIVRTRSTTLSPPEELSSPEPTTVLAVQISSLLNSPSSSEVESPEPTVAETTDPPTTTTISTTSTTTTPAPSSAPTRRTILRRRGSTTTTTSTAAPALTQTVKRSNFLRRTKATAPPDVTEDTTDTETTTKSTRRGISKFKSRKELAAEKKAGNSDVEQKRPSLNGGAARSERPGRNFVRRRLGGANATTSSSTTSGQLSTRRPFRVASRRRPLPGTISTTTTTTEATTAETTTDATAADVSEEYLQDISSNESIEDIPVSRSSPKTPKLQRRPLVLKDIEPDQNPSATNEDERKRQSKKYSASFKQNQLQDKLKTKTEATTETSRTTIDDFSAETALAIAAHQLLSAPIPVIQNYDDEKPTKKSHTTQEYRYIPTFTEAYTDTKTPYFTSSYPTDEYADTKTRAYTEEYTQSPFRTEQYSTKNYRTEKYDNTPYDEYSSTPIYKTSQDYVSTPETVYTSTYEAPRTTNVPTSTVYPSTYTSRVSKPAGFSTPNVVPTFSEPSLRTASRYTSPVLSTLPSRTPVSSLSPSTARYLGSTNKLIPVPVEVDYTTGGYSSLGQEPSYFTREYLLESPVTKTYDDEYQYLSPVTTPQTTSTTRKAPKKTVYRKISTTIAPTEPVYLAQVTTPQPRRVPSRGPPASKPFEKIPTKAKPAKTYRPVENYDYYDEGEERAGNKYEEGTKVILHARGTIECLDIGNFPHPNSCKKFISCARLENGSLLGWEYICPKGLSFDPVGGICNWSAGLGCDEKDL